MLKAVTSSSEPRNQHVIITLDEPGREPIILRDRAEVEALAYGLCAALNRWPTASAWVSPFTKST